MSDIADKETEEPRKKRTSKKAKVPATVASNPGADVVTTQPHFVPEYGVTVDAESIEDAVEQAKQSQKEGDE